MEKEVSELVKKVRQLELKTKKQSFELFSGNYTSTFKGRGMSFYGVRAYQYGDDIRTIDWNVTSRMLEPHIKEFEEERELTFILLIDVSLSNSFGSHASTKRDIINEVAATISFSALNNNDKVGVIFFSEKVEKYIPPKKGKGHVLTIIRDLIQVEPTEKKTDIGDALRFLQNTIKKKSIVFLLSDFIESKNYDHEMRLSANKHRFYAIQFYDQAERDFPNLGIVPLYNQETDQLEWVDTSEKSFKQKMETQITDNLSQTKQMFKKFGGEYCEINIQEPYIRKLAEVFQK